MCASYQLQWFCATLLHCGHLLFTWKTCCGLKFYFGQFDRSGICTEVSFTSPEIMWMLIIKLPHTELKFYPEVKSQTSLNSLRVSRKRDLSCWKCVVDGKANQIKQFGQSAYVLFLVLQRVVCHQSESMSNEFILKTYICYSWWL